MRSSPPLRSSDDPRPPPFSAETLWAGAYQQRGRDHPFLMFTWPAADRRFEGTSVEPVPCGKAASSPSYLALVDGICDRGTGLARFEKCYVGAGEREMNSHGINYIGAMGEIAGRSTAEGLWSFTDCDGTFFLIELKWREGEPGIYATPAATTIERLGCIEPAGVAAFIRRHVGSRWSSPIWAEDVADG